MKNAEIRTFFNSVKQAASEENLETFEVVVIVSQNYVSRHKIAIQLDANNSRETILA